MGIFKPKQAPPTAVSAEDRPNTQAEQNGAGDVEKDGVLQNEADAQNVRAEAEMEKRVVRKIDYHVPPLVTFLCMYLSFSVRRGSHCLMASARWKSTSRRSTAATLETTPHAVLFMFGVVINPRASD
jgi:hypothetical protein